MQRRTVTNFLIFYMPDDAQITLVSELIQKADLKDNDRCHLHFTLAKMNEDLGDLYAAYINFVAGGKFEKNYCLMILSKMN